MGYQKLYKVCRRGPSALGLNCPADPHHASTAPPSRSHATPWHCRHCTPNSLCETMPAPTRPPPLLPPPKQILLERSKTQLHAAFRLFADSANYTVLVHCIHGER